MRNARFFHMAISIGALIFLGLMNGPTMAQGAQAQLTARSVMLAAEQTDGPPAGASLSAKGALINGIRVPFDSQPAANISGILQSDYPGNWLALITGQFDSPNNSADFLLRVYVLNVDWRRSASGQGEVVPTSWWHIADPEQKITKNIVNANTPNRYLTGKDFAPRAFQRANDGTYWVAESLTPSLLRIDAVGKILEPPIPIDGTLQGMSITPDRNTLIIAVRQGGGVVFLAFDLTRRDFSQLPPTYPLSGNNSVGGIAMINADEAFVIETDSLQNNRARDKKIYVVNIRQPNIQKNLAVDLLNIDDPNQISTNSVFKAPPNAFGLGQNFKFPFATITAIHPTDEQTLMIVNNNRLPYSLGRSSSQADATEFITVRLPNAVGLDPAFLSPLR